ncbi:putative tail tubular protein A [Pelagibacter phage Lederberg EXVC029P]|nr:putative tail tubular protein A [Pelagibacter phage Lederberg EXVC029P]
MASVVDICNGALNQLGATTILTLTEDSKNARLCNARYTQVRDSVFRSHPWNCLQKRLQLAADSDAPAWGFTKQYTLPADCLRVLTILDYDADYKIEGRKILTDNSTMKILYISRVTDPNEYDELLRETLSAALAADIAYAITSSNPTATNMYNLFQSKLKEARFVDSTEGQNLSPDKGMADVIGADTFINSRF